jgi:hypothetical protein
MRSAFLLALLFVSRLGFTETNAPATNAPVPPKAPANGSAKATSAGKVSKAAQTAAQLQSALDQLTQSNHDLLDLLKKQQAVLEDMQFDRRLQSRQIESLEERLGSAMQENAQLQKQVAALEADAAVRPAAAPIPEPTPATIAPTPAPTPVKTEPVVETPPAPPESYLPPAGSEGPPGVQSWHRLFTLKGTEGRKTDLFAIEGHAWRVLWHNEDKPGKNFKGTSGLFINAFPKDDTIPQRVCGKVGSGGDSVELQGPGNFYLQIDASGGSWEVAVEDFH